MTYHREPPLEQPSAATKEKALFLGSRGGGAAIIPSKVSSRAAEGGGGAGPRLPPPLRSLLFLPNVLEAQPLTNSFASLLPYNMNPEKSKEEFRSASQNGGGTGVKDLMDSMGLGMLGDQLGELKLGELLDTPPPGLDEAIAISKVGTAAAYYQTGLFFAKHYLILLSASVLVITWLNLSNDVYDFDTEADRNKKESVVNILGSRGVTQFAAITSLVLGFMGFFWACADAGNFHFILLVTFVILCGCPPFRLSYLGLGEP